MASDASTTADALTLEFDMRPPFTSFGAPDVPAR
jgi:hypothetical protein